MLDNGDDVPRDAGARFHRLETHLARDKSCSNRGELKSARELGNSPTPSVRPFKSADVGHLKLPLKELDDPQFSGGAGFAVLVQQLIKSG